SYLGGMAAVGWHIHAMQGLGLLMMLLFLHIYFAPYRRLKKAIHADDTAQAGRRVGQIRIMVGINLVLGLLVVVVGSAGRYL
ncbi:MAG: putative membrane protein, partial [Psychromonas sp.]|uniref:CopD family protein n=1 Tax=Psychromonas sp. TaxID=1884585 RepID=UPI0039E51B43